MTRKRRPRFTPVPTASPRSPRTAPQGRLKLVADSGADVIEPLDDWPPDYDRMCFDPDEVVPAGERAQLVREVVGDDDAAFFETMRSWQADGWRRGDTPF
ncbi:polysaccharide deacetylase family protein [Leucobacter salsicius]|uniref:hypothetical protein n=1 Tax=Leucobacter salsicius TaxID=664638 RepID=UPI0012FA060D|nr:hypothetical protein [Leucobacter salsicius]